MGADDLKVIGRAWFDHVMNGRDVDAIDRFYSEDYTYHGPEGAMVRGRDQAKTVARHLIEAMPDRVSTVEDQISEGNRVVTRWVSRGTQVRAIGATAPAAEPVAVHGITISRIENGLIVEDWEIIKIVQE
jgi:predicted ester cyclase